jgi:hypothetical protein
MLRLRAATVRGEKTGKSGLSGTVQKTANGALIAAILLVSASLDVTPVEAGSKGGGSAPSSDHGTQVGNQNKITAAATKGPGRRGGGGGGGTGPGTSTGGGKRISKYGK